jgi:two-component system, sensor histidine kinase YesM
VRRFRDLSIRTKLSVSYFLLVLFFLCLFLAINTGLATRENESQALRSASHVFSQTRAYLQFKTESVRNLLYFVTTNASVQELFERRADYYREEIGRWPIDSQNLEKILYPTTINPDIVTIRFYMKFGLAAVFQNDKYQTLASVSGAAWYRRLVANDRRVCWFLDDAGKAAGATGFVHAARGVFSSQNLNELTGIVQFDIPQAVLAAALGNAILTESTAAVLMDGDGAVVCSAGAPSAARDGTLWRRMSALRGGEFSTESWSTVALGTGTYLVGTQSIENSDWVLALVMPRRDIVRMSARPNRQMLLVLLLIIPLTLLFAFAVSRSATKRIQNLSVKMVGVGSGDFAPAPNPENSDEIGQLTSRFNLMISEIAELVEEKYRLGKEVKQLELKALQAQINPHFLYNTLDLINWISLRYEAHEIRTLVNALSRFYKLSLSKGEDTVTVGDEIELAKSYIQIQNMRYEDSITLQVDVPDELGACPILKLVIQPLVENAISHGIMLKKEEKGTVRLGGVREDGDILLTVEDDGVGMTEEQCGLVLSGGVSTEEHHGYGVHNIHERLRLNYGPGFGLAFRSAPGKGTVVTIRIPAAKETE